MSFKPLDLQMAIPRTQEFSGLQQQALQKPVADQNMLAKQASKHTEELRTQNTSVEETNQTQVKANHDRNQDETLKDPSANKKKDQEDDAEQADSVHPYKGHRLDIKL